MAKPRSSLLDQARTLPDAPGCSLEQKLLATGRKAEIDGLLHEYDKGSLAAKLPSLTKLREFLSDQLHIEISRCGFSAYMAKRNGKKPA